MRMHEAVRKSQGRRGSGEGTIQKRADGRWFAALDVGYVKGVRKRKTLYGKTRREVGEKLNAALRARATGQPLPDERRMTGDYLKMWIEDIVPGTVKVQTERSYARVLDQYVIPHIGRVPLAKLTPQHVQTMRRALEAQGLSPRTRQYARS